MFKVLIVEDDEDLNRTMCAFLSQNGYETKGCLSANEAYNAMYNNPFDIIISDIMMSEIDGFEFAETVRKVNPTVPIIFATARDDFGAKKRGFSAGIDDYMTKPLDLPELLLRISALLRRANIAQSKKITVGNFVMDEDARTATNKDEEISLTAREFNLLYKLLSHQKKTRLSHRYFQRTCNH